MSLTYASFVALLRERFPELGPLLDPLHEQGFPDDQSIGPYLATSAAFVPALLQLEVKAHVSDPVPDHVCRAADVAEWTEAMATSDDDDVVNAVCIEIFEAQHPTIMDALPWGEATRNVVDRYQPLRKVEPGSSH